MKPKTKQVLIMKANGLLVKQIAATLDIHRRTVEWHIESARRELDALNSTHAVAIAMRDGVILAGEIGCIMILCWSSLFGDADARRGPSARPAARSARREMII